VRAELLRRATLALSAGSAVKMGPSGRLWQKMECPLAQVSQRQPALGQYRQPEPPRSDRCGRKFPAASLISLRAGPSPTAVVIDAIGTCLEGPRENNPIPIPPSRLGWRGRAGGRPGRMVRTTFIRKWRLARRRLPFQITSYFTYAPPPVLSHYSSEARFGNRRSLEIEKNDPPAPPPPPWTATRRRGKSRRTCVCVC